MRYVKQKDRDFYDSDLIIRTARKEYLCEGGPSRPREQHKDCRDTKPGDEYLEVRWGADEFDPGGRVCLKCAHAYYNIDEIIVVKPDGGQEISTA